MCVCVTFCMCTKIDVCAYMHRLLGRKLFWDAF